MAGVEEKTEIKEPHAIRAQGKHGKLEDCAYASVTNQTELIQLSPLSSRFRRGRDLGSGFSYRLVSMKVNMLVLQRTPQPTLFDSHIVANQDVSWVPLSRPLVTACYTSETAPNRTAGLIDQGNGAT